MTRTIQTLDPWVAHKLSRAAPDMIRIYLNLESGIPLEAFMHMTDEELIIQNRDGGSALDNVFCNPSDLLELTQQPWVAECRQYFMTTTTHHGLTDVEAQAISAVLKNNLGALLDRVSAFYGLAPEANTAAWTRLVTSQTFHQTFQSGHPSEVMRIATILEILKLWGSHADAEAFYNALRTKILALGQVVGQSVLAGLMGILKSWRGIVRGGIDPNVAGTSVTPVAASPISRLVAPPAVSGQSSQPGLLAENTSNGEGYRSQVSGIVRPRGSSSYDITERPALGDSPSVLPLSYTQSGGSSSGMDDTRNHRRSLLKSTVLQSTAVSDLSDIVLPSSLYTTYVGQLTDKKRIAAMRTGMAFIVENKSINVRIAQNGGYDLDFRGENEARLAVAKLTEVGLSLFPRGAGNGGDFYYGNGNANPKQTIHFFDQIKTMPTPEAIILASVNEYIKVRAQGNDYKHTLSWFYKDFNKENKRTAAKNFFRLLTRENAAPLTATDLKMLQDGELGKLARWFDFGAYKASLKASAREARVQKKMGMDNI